MPAGTRAIDIPIGDGQVISSRVDVAWQEHAETTPPLQISLARVPLDVPVTISEAPVALPGDWTSSITTRKLRLIGERMLRSDLLIKRRFLGGKTIDVIVPYESQKRADRLTIIHDFNDQTELPVTLCDLVRPLLLSKPDDSHLYPYQKIGVKWLVNSDARLLADDMGLGKTLQAITAIRGLVWSGEVNAVLVLAPKSLVINWLGEFARWAPELVCAAVDAVSRDSRVIWRSAASRVHVVVTHYEEIRAASAHLDGILFDLIVADEAHRLRNSSAQVTAAVRRLGRTRMWALTGTPIERDTEDLATIMSLLDPKRFSIRDGSRIPEMLRARVKEHLLRRRKNDVLKDLPPVTETVEYVEMLPSQQAAYESALAGETSDGRKLEGALAVFNELRQICDYDPLTRESAKADRVIELILSIEALGEKVIVFSYLLEPLRIIQERLGEKDFGGKVEVLEGGMSSEERANAVARFRHNSNVMVLLGSSRVAGEGLTLTEANHVIFFNQWWNPSSNNQAKDRVNRIGQKRPVNVHILVCIRTVEEYLQKILKEKSELFTEVIEKLSYSNEIDDGRERDVLNTIQKHFRGTN